MMILSSPVSTEGHTSATTDREGICGDVVDTGATRQKCTSVCRLGRTKKSHQEGCKLNYSFMTFECPLEETSDFYEVESAMVGHIKIVRRYMPAAYVLRSAWRAAAAAVFWIFGFETTAHILAVLAAMSVIGPVEINLAKDAVAKFNARRSG